MIASTLTLLAHLAVLAQPGTWAPPAPQEIPPVLAFPEPGLDDPTAFEGYRTRFHRDAAGNVVQIYLDAKSGRVVHVWADADNQSLGFTARTADGRPAELEWGSEGATSSIDGALRTLTYRLRSTSPELVLGHFLLGSMRVERDFQYSQAHLRPFGEAYVPAELRSLVERIERLEPAEREVHLALLNARDLAELRARLQPRLDTASGPRRWTLEVERPMLDGRTRLELRLSGPIGDVKGTSLTLRNGTLHIRSLEGRPIELEVRIATDAAPLTPLYRDDIFNADFFAFYSRIRAARDSVLSADPSATAHPAVLRYRRLERQVRGVELLSYREKLMAGLPNFATYFGRDMLMTALLMQPVWADGMLEHVIGSALAKVRADGQVSHEEALGGQAIREHAAEYAALVDEWARRREAGDAARADSALAAARAVLAGIRTVRENHMMRDDDFQLPVVAARYLANPRIPAQRKRAWLLEPAAPGAAESRLARLLRNLDHVARSAEPYAQRPAAANLVAFPARADGAGWFPGSWRDSGAGYAGGRYAMDVNAIWVPAALDATARILEALGALGFGAAELRAQAPFIASGPLAVWLDDPARARHAAQVWRGAASHFLVRLPAAKAASRIAEKLAWLPEPEARFWRARLGGWPAANEPELEFLALSLDADARPIPVMSTDPAMRMLLEALAAAGPPDSATAAAARRDARTLRLPYPAGLLVQGLGPLAANDAYAPRAVWDAFDRDRYHSPRVVWGREVNIIVAGLAGLLRASTDDAGRPVEPRLAPLVEELNATLRMVAGAADASGLGHFELWSYRIEDGRLLPVRYGSSTDVQLWNLTDLAVQFVLERLPAAAGARSL
ncbi:MAG TPA: hypothetical protein VIL18_09585 [Longimicrobiales bacterium]